MGMLAELFVQFTTKGVEQVSAAADQLKGKLDGLVSSAGNIGNAMTSAMGGGILGGAAAVGGMAMAGVANSGQMQAISSLFSVLNRELGSVLLPIVEQLTQVLADAIPIASDFVDTLQPAIDAVANALGSVWEAVRPLVGALAQAEAVWLSTIAEVAAGFVNLLMPAINAVAAALKWWVDTVKDAINFVRKLVGLEEVKPSKTRRLSQQAGGFEDVTAAYARIAQASLRASLGGGKSTQERHLEVAEQQLQEQQKTTEAISNIRPAVA